MPPIALNRRRFLGYSAAGAGLALTQGAPHGATPSGSLRVGVVGVGNRGTTLLRTLLEVPGVVVPVVCDPEPRHRAIHPEQATDWPRWRSFWWKTAARS